MFSLVVVFGAPYRGLYVCRECGSVLNADVNGALNILKKSSPRIRKDRGSGGVNPPMRIRLPAFGKQTPHEAPSVRAG